MWRELRVIVRSLLRTPAFTALVILILALGIGANSAVFSIIDKVLLQDLPFARPNQLVRIWESNREQGWERFSVSGLNYLDWRLAAHRGFEQLAAFQAFRFNLTGDDEPEVVTGSLCTASLFPLLGIDALHGRTFTTDDERSGGRVVLLSEGLWRRRFNGDPGVVGRPLTLDGEIYTVIGVMPAAFQFPDLLWAAELNARADLWVPLDLDPAKQVRKAHSLSVVGRLRPGISVAAGRAELDGIASGLAREYPESNRGWGVVVRPLREAVVGNVESAMLILAGAVAFVLLIACANVANLLLARVLSRSRETALRTALGASRTRLVAQQVAESLLLAFAGAGLGLLLAYWALRLFGIAALDRIPRIAGIAIDGRVFALSFVLALLTGLVLGIVPTVRALRVDPNRSLKEGSGRATAAGSTDLRWVLVVVEYAVALLCAAGVMLRSFVALERVDPGFEPKNLLIVDFKLPKSRATDPVRLAAFYRDGLERLKNLPGAQSVGSIQAVPLSGQDMLVPFQVLGEPSVPTRQPWSAQYRSISPDTFRALDVPLLRGRAFGEADRSDSAGVVILSQGLAKRLWPNADAIGKHLVIEYEAPRSREVVGVVGDVRYLSLTSDPDPALYVPYVQSPLQILPLLNLLVRTTSDPAQQVAGMRTALRSFDAALPISIRPMDDLMSSAVSRNRFSMKVLALFAVIALLLAALGIYSVTAYSTQQRRREIGVRMALGADTAEIRRMVIREAMRTALFGLVLGLCASWLTGRLLTTLVYRVSPHDPVTLASVSAVLLAIGLLASYLPVRAATKGDPSLTLRSE
jgi:putative ABC transport system permease protein